MGIVVQNIERAAPDLIALLGKAGTAVVLDCGVRDTCDLRKMSFAVSDKRLKYV